MLNIVKKVAHQVKKASMTEGMREIQSQKELIDLCHKMKINATDNMIRDLIAWKHDSIPEAAPIK